MRPAIDTGLRWHARAFDRKSGEFRDFVITRIQNPIIHEDESAVHERMDADIQWTRIVELDLVPHPRLNRPEIVQMDYGMQNGSIRLRVRATWQAQRDIMLAAQRIAAIVGTEEYLDFNLFETKVHEACSAIKQKLSTAELKQVLNAMSWRDPRAAKVIKKLHKLTGAKLKDLSRELQTTADRLCDYGYWPGEKAGELVVYESDSELRDTENVPLAKSKMTSASSVVHEHFLREVRAHRRSRGRRQRVRRALGLG